MVNQSTELAQEIVRALLLNGTTEVVVCPGSRNAPLSWQLAELASAGQVKLHTRIDEREAGFLALGLAKATRRPVPVVVTSGTAVANLLPAVVEAYHSGIPLIVLSADRPSAVRGNSAPQTTWQVGMFRNFVKVELDVFAPSAEIFAAIKSSCAGHFGPVQINAQFDLPLLPDDLDSQLKIETAKLSVPELKSGPVIELPPHGLLIVGDIAPGPEVTKLAELAATAGYPIIWEPTSQLHGAANALNHGTLLLQVGKTPQPEVVITAGLIGLSRSTLGLLKSAPKHIAIHLASAGKDLPDPVQSADQILDYIPSVSVQPDPNWLAEWQKLDSIAHEIVRSNLSSKTLTGPSAAIEIWNQLDADSTLVISPSWPVRHLEMYAGNRSGLTTFGNRGVNGIDGLISTAAGISLSRSHRTYLVTGDIAFLHGMGGLNISADNMQPNLTVIVLDNDGSGIFSQLEQGAAKYEKHFEKVFGTPHGRDLWVIAEALGVPAVRVTTKTELVSALNRTNLIPGLQVIVCTTGERKFEQALVSKISTEVTSAL